MGYYKLGDYITIETKWLNGKPTHRVSGKVIGFSRCYGLPCFVSCTENEKRDKLVKLKLADGHENIYCPERVGKNFVRRAIYTCKINKISEV